jgi:hypothetical protein
MEYKGLIKMEKAMEGMFMNHIIIGPIILIMKLVRAKKIIFSEINGWQAIHYKDTIQFSPR